MDKNSLLNDRFEIKKILGHGGLATTYLAIDLRTGQKCALKALSFQHIEEWKTWELAEREANILKSLNHPQIPGYIDFFKIETEQDTQVCLVQEYVDGHSLAQLLNENWHFTEDEVIDIAIGMCRILEYLHHFSPPLIHRDIKPGNIILSEDKQPHLLDFDNVKDSIQSQSQVSHGMPTIVGTYGYMPPEQSEGRPVPGSDIYALGMTLITLLSQKDPSQMEKDGMHLRFRPHVNISSGLEDVLEKMIVPDWQARYQKAADVRHDLERIQTGDVPIKAQTSPVLQRPSWLKYFIAADVLITLLVAAGIYFLILRTPAPPPLLPSSQEATPLPASPERVNAPPPIVSESENAPRLQPESINAPVNAAVSPVPQEPTASPPPIVSPSMSVIQPLDDTISVDIYRDFIYLPQGWPMGLSVGQSVAGGLDKHPYEDLLREPQYSSSKVLYGYFPLGNGEDQQIAFVLDELDQPNWIAYVDKNNNEDLTDDGPPYRNQGTGIFAAEVDVQIEVVTLSGEQTVQPYHLWMWVIQESNAVKFYARCHYAGVIAVDGGLYDAIAFEQFDHNGLFREKGLWIDLDRNKELDEETEKVYNGGEIIIAGHRYRITLQYP